MSHKLRRLTTVAYAVNGSGLGHLTRVLAILRWMKRLALLSGVRLDAYILTSSEAPGLALEEGFATFKIPSKTAIRESGLPKEDYLRLARQWVWHSLGLIKPDLLLVDTFPGGSFGELIHALDVPRARVFVQRAMKDEFARLPGVQNLLPFYDRILVPVEPHAHAPATDSEVAARTRRVGPIMLRSREEMRPREEARRRLGIPDGKLGVWLSAGGGGDPKAGSGIETLVEALRSEPDLHLVVGAGPLYRGNPVRDANITWLTGFNAMEEFNGLDCAVSAGGYNSFHELLHAGVPTAFFAQEKIADEQSRRVRAAAEAGCALSLDVNGAGSLNTEDLARVLEQFRDPGRRRELALKAAAFVPHNCARDAAFETLAAILSPDALEEALEIGSAQFFLTLSQQGVSLDDIEPVYRRLKSVGDLDAVERGDIILRLISGPNIDGQTAARAFHVLAQHFPFVTTEAGAEELLEAALQIVKAASFADERGLLELLRALPKDEQSQPKALAASLCRLLQALDAQGDSIWRGRAALARHLGVDSTNNNLHVALAAATVEIENNSRTPDFKGGTVAGETRDSSYGD